MNFLASSMMISILVWPAAAGSDVDVLPDGLNPNLSLTARDWSSGGESRRSHQTRSSESAFTGAAAPRAQTRCFFDSGDVQERRFERTFRCGARGTVASEPDEVAPQEEPELTEGDVRRAVSEIPMPALRVTVQPGGRTLVNVPTILHTDPRPVRESITLLGHDIDVEATPTGYTWHHGDGTSRTTTRPGRPYPAKDVTHTYQRTAERVSIRVDTPYTVRYRVDGGAWTPLGQPLTAAGTATPLEVAEAAPVLVSPRR